MAEESIRASVSSPGYRHSKSAHKHNGIRNCFALPTVLRRQLLIVQTLEDYGIKRPYDNRRSGVYLLSVSPGLHRQRSRAMCLHFRVHSRSFAGHTCLRENNHWMIH